MPVSVRSGTNQRGIPVARAGGDDHGVSVCHPELSQRQRLGIHQPSAGQLLEKLCIEQTKSRSWQINDNALVESKNASTVRKHLGYSHIPQHLQGGAQ